MSIPKIKKLRVLNEKELSVFNGGYESGCNRCETCKKSCSPGNKNGNNGNGNGNGNGNTIKLK